MQVNRHRNISVDQKTVASGNEKVTCHHAGVSPNILDHAIALSGGIGMNSH